MSAQNMAARQSRPKSGTLTTSEILKYGAFSVLAAIVLNLIARAIFFSILDLPRDFLPLSVGSIAAFTFIGTSLGVLALWVLNRISDHPLRLYTWVALGALVLSILPNLIFMSNPSAAPMPGGTSQAFQILTIFHILAAAMSIAILHRLRLKRH